MFLLTFPNNFSYNITRIVWLYGEHLRVCTRRLSKKKKEKKTNTEHVNWKARSEKKISNTQCHRPQNKSTLSCVLHEEKDAIRYRNWFERRKSFCRGYYTRSPGVCLHQPSTRQSANRYCHQDTNDERKSVDGATYPPGLYTRLTEQAK